MHTSLESTIIFTSYKHARSHARHITSILLLLVLACVPNRLARRRDENQVNRLGANTHTHPVILCYIIYCIISQGVRHRSQARTLWDTEKRQKNNINKRKKYNIAALRRARHSGYHLGTGHMGGKRTTAICSVPHIAASRSGAHNALRSVVRCDECLCPCWRLHALVWTQHIKRSRPGREKRLSLMNFAKAKVDTFRRIDRLHKLSAMA